MAVNLQALDMFRTASGWEANGVANLDDGKEIRQNGTYGGALSALTRSKTEVAENNRVRTELLRALGHAFNLSGMQEEEGKVTFSKSFMDSLQKLLGADLKRDDFKVDGDGNVTSGRPLTARRINAILAKAERAAAEGVETAETGAVSAPAKTGMEKTLSVTGGLRKDATYGPYAEKLQTIQKDLSRLGKEKNQHVQKFFRRVEMTLDFLYNELDVDRAGEGDSDPSVLRNDPGYEFLRDIGDLKANDKPVFQYYDDKTKEFVKLADTYKYQNEVLWNRVGGGLLHLERAKFRSDESTDIAPLRKYIVDNLRLFVMKSIDCYLASKEAGKLPEFFEHLQSPGACIEDQCLHMVGFEAEHLSDGLEAVSEKEAADLERLANQDPARDPDIDQEIGAIFDEIGNEQWFLDKEEFDEDIAKVLDERLLGKFCTITKYNTSTHKFEPLIENGQRVVRRLTAEDIRTFGALAYKEIFG